MRHLCAVVNFRTVAKQHLPIFLPGGQTVGFLVTYYNLITTNSCGFMFGNGFSKQSMEVYLINLYPLTVVN